MSISLDTLRRIAIVLVIAAIAVSAMGIGKLEINSHYSAYFDDDDPRLIAHAEIAEIYSRHDAVFVILQSNTGFLDSDNYLLLESVTALLDALPTVTTALSITNLGILGETLTPDGYLIPSMEQLAADDRALGLLLADNAEVAGIWVQVELPEMDSRAILNSVGEIRELVETAIATRPVSAHFSGTLALNAAYINVVKHDLTRIVPLLLIVMIFVLGRILGNTRAVLLMLPVGICSVLAAFGVAGLLGVELAAINAFSPIMILSISMAGCIHMTLSYIHYRANGRNAEDASIKAANYNLLPMSLANGTTALGFLGLALSPSPPVRVFGYTVVAGIVVSYVLCMTLLPILNARFDPKKQAGIHWSIPIERLSSFVCQHRTGIVVSFLVLALPAGWFASRNVIGDNIFEYFAKSHDFYQDTQIVEEKLSGVNEVHYSLASGEDYGVFDADVVIALSRLTTWLEQQWQVNRVVSVSNISAIREAQNDGRLQQRLDFYRERIDTSNGLNEMLAMGVSKDYSSVIASVYLQPLNSAQLINFDASVHAWAIDNLGRYELTSGGPTLMFADIGQRNILGMLTALFLALLTAAVVLGAVFRSTRLAWIGLICNFLPVLMVYSVWAIVNGQISIGAAVVMGMILGIVLDDSIYLLAAYHRGCKNKLDDPVEYALRRVGPAVVVTTITLILGLSLGLLSDFGPIWNMSMLSVAIIGVALVIDLSLLPALLAVNGKRAAAT